MPSSASSPLADRTTALVGWTVAWRAAGAVTTLALSSYLAHTYTPAEFGRYVLVLNLLIYLALLVTFGQDQGLLRYLPELLARRDQVAARDLLKKSATVVALAWLVTAVAVWALRPLIDAAVNVPIGNLLLLGTILLLASAAAGVLSFALVAVYDMRSQAIATLGAGLLTLLLAILFTRRGAGLPGVLVAGAVGQGALAVFYVGVLLRRIRQGEAVAGQRIVWRRLLRYASGWLPSLLIASAVGLEFESVFLAHFRGTTAVAYYGAGYTIPQRLVALLPSLLTGAWVVGTVETFQGDVARLRAGVIAFYKGLFMIALPLLTGGIALIPPLIRLVYGSRGASYIQAATIAPLLLTFFIVALLTSPWGLVVRVRELAWVNAGISLSQVGFAALADWWLIAHYALAGAVTAVGLTTVVTVALSFAAWRRFDRASLAVPWRYGGRCALAAAPYLVLWPLSLPLIGRAHVGRSQLLPLLMLAAALTLAWLWLVRRLRLLSAAEVPLLHQSRHVALRRALGWLAPDSTLLP